MVTNVVSDIKEHAMRSTGRYINSIFVRVMFNIVC